MADVDFSNLIADTSPDDALVKIIEQVDNEVIAWTADYHSSGKRGAELSESDVTAAVANRYARVMLIRQSMRNAQAASIDKQH